MSLEALAPDQRAVVQLVLQQERSYEELAGLLGISAVAVRDRAHRGLERLVTPGDGLTPVDRARVADYLLGQLSVSARGETRELLATSAEAREWAQELASALEGVARNPLPEIPRGAADGGGAAAAPVDEPEPIAPADAGVPAADDPTTEAPAVRARPRPRREAGRRRAPEPESESEGEDASPAAAPAGGDRRRSSLLGGALLIGGLAILLALLVIWLVSRDGDDGDRASTEATPTATATATPTPSVQPLGQITLRGTDEAPRARGQVTVFVGQGNAVGFTVEGTGLPRLPEGQAYAVWLTGGDRPRRLGYAPTVGANGRLGTSGPRKEDAERFPRWLSQARTIVVSRESVADARQPGPIVMSGSVRQARG